MTTIIDKLNTIRSFNESIKGIEKFNSNYKGINEISVIDDKGKGRILKNKELKLTDKLQETLGKLKQVADGVNKFTRTDLNVLKEISKNTGPAPVAPVTAPAPVTVTPRAPAPVTPVAPVAPVTSDKTGDNKGTIGEEGEENPQYLRMHSRILNDVEETNSNPQIYSVEGTVEKYLTPEQKKEFDRINKNLKSKDQKEIVLDDKLSNLSTQTPKTGESGMSIQWGNNPIWIGKIYTDERGVENKNGYNVFMKDDGFSVVDKMPLNPAVTFSGENATIKKKNGKYILLDEKDEGQGYGFEFEYKGTVGTLSSYFGIDEGKTGGKKKSKSKRTKKNGSLKKRK